MLWLKYFPSVKTNKIAKNCKCPQIQMIHLKWISENK